MGLGCQARAKYLLTPLESPTLTLLNPYFLQSPEKQLSWLRLSAPSELYSKISAPYHCPASQPLLNKLCPGQREVTK